MRARCEQRSHNKSFLQSDSEPIMLFVDGSSSNCDRCFSGRERAALPDVVSSSNRGEDKKSQFNNSEEVRVSGD
jgi:hypothetical protein